jgi:fimbrial chaperone protein
MNTKALRASLAAMLLSFASAFVGAFTMEPMTAFLAPSGAGNVATFRIVNDGTERLAIRFRVLTRAASQGTQELNAPADELFIVYPSRLLVEPGAAATAKVQWRGPAKLLAERSFRFVAEQVPIDAVSAKAGGSGLKIMFRYLAALYVGETDYAPDLVATVVGAAGSKGEKGYSVEIRNNGKRHIIAADTRIELGSNREQLISSEELGPLSGANYLPGAGRKLFIPRSDADEGRIYAARIDYAGAY